MCDKERVMKGKIGKERMKEERWIGLLVLQETRKGGKMTGKEMKG